MKTAFEIVQETAELLGESTNFTVHNTTREEAIDGLSVYKYPESERYCVYIRNYSHMEGRGPDLESACLQHLFKIKEHLQGFVDRTETMLAQLKKHYEIVNEAVRPIEESKTEEV